MSFLSTTVCDGGVSEAAGHSSVSIGHSTARCICVVSSRLEVLSTASGYTFLHICVVQVDFRVFVDFTDAETTTKCFVHPRVPFNNSVEPETQSSFVVSEIGAMSAILLGKLSTRIFLRSFLTIFQSILNGIHVGRFLGTTLS